MKKYAEFLNQQKIRSTKRHESVQPIRCVDDSYSLEVLDSSDKLDEAYTSLSQKLVDTPCYTPVSLLDFEPTNERYARRHWIDNMSFSFQVSKLTYFHGNNLGNLTYIWKIPPRLEDRQDLLTSKAVMAVKADFQTYSTRAMRRAFMDRYQEVAKAGPVVFRDMYRYLTGDVSAPESVEQGLVDERLMDFLSGSDEVELFHDLRAQNGQANGSKFDPFWDETAKYFEEISLAVHERRHTQNLYLPVAMSVEDLRQTIKERLLEDAAIPSNEWLRLQFWPKNVTSLRAIHHTGRFDIKFAVQQRLARAYHPDAKFAAHQLKLLKEFAVKWRNDTNILFLDDKAVIPLGEPGRPVGTGVRAHSKSLTTANTQTLLALDHDFHIHGVIPSVCLVGQIPESSSDSFYHGQAFVTVKNKVFQPSNAARHGTEVRDIMRHLYSTDGVISDKPILLCYTDGGPDHRTTYASVQFASLALFILLDLDMFVTCRTAPSQSYANLAERVNALLNLALQNVALARESMGEEYEDKIKHISSMKDMRKRADRFPQLKDKLLESVKPVMKLLDDRFGRLKLKEEPVTPHPAASQEAIVDFMESLKVIDQDLQLQNLTQKTISSSPQVASFFEKYCRQRQYIFQIKKCRPVDVAN
jgi:hypothetical protein